MKNEKLISVSAVARATARILSLDQAGQEKLADVIFREQPLALAHVLALSKVGVPCRTIDHVLHVLMVVFECFTEGRTRLLPKITEKVIERANRNTTAMLRLLDAESGDERERIQRMTITSHTEPNVLAYVVSYLHGNGLTDLSQSNEYAVRAAKTVLDAFAAVRRLDQETEPSTGDQTVGA